MHLLLLYKYYASLWILGSRGHPSSSSIVLVFRVSWYMELKHGQWRLMIWEVWKGQSVWWWDGCVGCPWKTENAVRIYASFLILIVLLMWLGVEDWDGLGIWSVRVWMIGCLLAEGWWWRGREVGAGVGRHGNSVLGMTWNCLVCIPSGLFQGYVGGLDLGQTSNPSLAWKNGRFQNKWWWWCSKDSALQSRRGILHVWLELYRVHVD